jgi:predicted enzyme related to lactoylglutathione lyase
MLTGVSFTAIAFDANDPPALAAFWAGLVGGVADVDADGDAFVRGGVGPDLDFLRVPEGKAAKNRIHLDLTVPDVEAAAAAAMELGASRATDVYEGDRWVVLRDPEGNEFCLLPPAATMGPPTAQG